ncbi:MAG: hypothetical protein ACYTHN_21795, partial [Planctomycetota bacterium]
MGTIVNSAAILGVLLAFGAGIAVGGEGKAGKEGKTAEGKTRPAPLKTPKPPPEEIPGAIKPPSPLEAEPPSKGFGHIRISAWAGYSNASLRKDGSALNGERLSWRRDFHGSPFFLSPVLKADFKLRRRVYGFVEFAWAYQEGSRSVAPGGIRFDNVFFPAG